MKHSLLQEKLKNYLFSTDPMILNVQIEKEMENVLRSLTTQKLLRISTQNLLGFFQRNSSIRSIGYEKKIIAILLKRFQKSISLQLKEFLEFLTIA